LASFSKAQTTLRIWEISKKLIIDNVILSIAAGVMVLVHDVTSLTGFAMMSDIFFLPGLHRYAISGDKKPCKNYAERGQIA
jgi:hypothetical protein